MYFRRTCCLIKSSFFPKREFSCHFDILVFKPHGNTLVNCAIYMTVRFSFIPTVALFYLSLLNFTRYTCSVFHECKDLISPSHVSNSVHLVLQSWSRQLAEVQVVQQQKTAPAVTPVLSRITLTGLMDLKLCCSIQMLSFSLSGINKIKACQYPSYLYQ